MPKNEQPDTNNYGTIVIKNKGIDWSVIIKNEQKGAKNR